MSFLSPPNVQKLKDERDVPGLIKALRYLLKSDVRKAAAEALGSLADPRAVQPLVEALKDDREEVAQAAAQALVACGEPAVEPLIKLVMQKKWDGSAWNLRTQAVTLACEALGQLNDPRAQNTLRIAAKDANSIVSAAAEQALQKAPKQ